VDVDAHHVHALHDLVHRRRGPPQRRLARCPPPLAPSSCFLHGHRRRHCFLVGMGTHCGALVMVHVDVFPLSALPAPSLTPPRGIGIWKVAARVTEMLRSQVEGAGWGAGGVGKGSVGAILFFQ
jgi:hypothetical protein